MTLLGTLVGIVEAAIMGLPGGCSFSVLGVLGDVRIGEISASD